MSESRRKNIFAKWRASLGPDLAQAAARFPISFLLIAIFTLLLLMAINFDTQFNDEPIFELAAGVSIAALFCVGTQLIYESGLINRFVQYALAVFLTALSIVAFMADDRSFFVPPLLPVLAILFVSISPTLPFRGPNGQSGQQDFFWWINHRAVVSAMIAITAMLVIWLGLLIIERSVSMLFGLQIDDIIYQFLFPLTGALFAPLFWLTTIPLAREYQSRELAEPDFLSNAIGFLGLYIFSPFLLIYALILIAYAVQIAVTGTYPEGTVAWMVLGFIGVSALNQLVLHPNFMQAKPFVARYLRVWPFLSIVPVIMLSIAIYIRVDAYGLTPERILLILGAIWASVLVVLALFQRLDIRLLPGLAAVLLLPASIGPFNMFNWSINDQMSRFETAYVAWESDKTPAAAQTIYGSAQYLLSESKGRKSVEIFLAAKGVTLDENASMGRLAEQLDLPNFEDNSRDNTYVWLENKQKMLVGNLETFFGTVQLPCCSKEIGDFKINVADNELIVMLGDEKAPNVDLIAWAKLQDLDADTMLDPKIEIEIGDRTLVLFVMRASLQFEQVDQMKIDHIELYAFEKAAQP